MLYDLAVPIEAGMAKIPILPEVEISQLTALDRGDGLEIREVRIATHIGTHMDAPSHAVRGGMTIDQISLEAVTGPGVVVPIIAKPGQEISLSSFLDAGMTIQEEDIVFLNTGWAGHMNDAMYYRNPYPSQELADFFVKHHVKILGVDCITVDMPPSQRPKGFNYPIHRTLLSHNTLIIENLADLSSVSGCRVFVWAFPLKIKGSDAGHVRVVAKIL